MRAATYVRLSASRLGEEAPGLERQRGDVQRLVRERGWELAEAFHDADTSAFRDVARPGFESLRRMVEEGAVGAVVVWKLDRAFRRLREAVEFLDLCQDRGVVFVSQQEGIDTSTPWGPVMFSLFASIAQMESQTRSDRTRAWHLQRAEAGMPAGGGSRPYGFHDDRVTHNLSEARKLRATARRILDGSSSLRQEARQLGMTTTGLHRVLTAPRTAGLRAHNGTTHPATWEPILDEQAWLAMRELLDRPGHGAGRRYLLSGGVAVCGLCGHNLVARPRGDGQRCYVCSSDGGGCGKIRVLAAPLEEFVSAQVSAWWDHQGAQRQEARTNNVEVMRRELDADERALETLARDHYVTRSITEREFRAARGALVDRIADAQARIAAAGTSRGFLQMLEDAENITPPWEVPPGTDPDPEELDEWKRWIAEVVERVTVGSAVRGRNKFDPERVTVVWKG